MSVTLDTAVIDLGLQGVQAELTDVPAVLSGQLPQWLRGSLLRIGPGAMAVGDQQFRHWFDGTAMLNRFDLEAGSVRYTNRFLDTRTRRANAASGRISYREFATDPCHSLFHRAKTIFAPRAALGVNPKVALARIAGELVALGETPMQVAFDPRTLRSAGVYDYAGGAHVTTAHPQIDPDTAAAYNVAIGFSAVSEYRVLQLLGGGRTRRLARKAVARPPYLHSFGMSGRYIVIFEYPYTVDTLTLLLSGRPFIENFRWQPERGTRILVFERATGALAWQCETEACFAFHHVNARDEGDEIVLDLIAYPDADIVSAFYIERLRRPDARLPLGQLRRYRLSRARALVTHEPLADAGIELSHFESARLNTRPYRWLYGLGMRPEAPARMYNRLVKLDLAGGVARDWHAPDCYPSEPIFVREPGATGEDAGIILSLVLDAQARTSFVLALDAVSFQERARAVLPHAVLLGYHGLFVPAEAGA